MNCSKLGAKDEENRVFLGAGGRGNPRARLQPILERGVILKPIQQSAQAAALAGGLTIIIVWAARVFAKVEVPVEVGSAITGVVTVLVGHFVDDPVLSQPTETAPHET